MPSLSFKDKQRNAVEYLADSQDNGPDEPDLSEYIDSDVLKEICKRCRERRAARNRKNIGA